MPDPKSPIGDPRVLVPPPADVRHAHLGWPKLAITSKGNFILAYSAAEYHGSDGGGCPAVSVSKDGGESFSKPQILAEFGQGNTYTHCGNMAIGVTTDDAIILIAMAYQGDEANSIFGWVSIDGGDNWQDVNVAALAAGRTGSIYGHVFQVAGRGYAVCGHHRPGAFPHDTGLWISFSQDGLHWGPPEHITDEPLVEPAVVCTGDAIVGLVRNTDSSLLNGYASLTANRRRMDWALSASPIRSSPGHRLPSPFITVDPEDDSRLIALMTERSLQGNTPGRISLWTSTETGANWTDRGTVVEFPHEDGDPKTDFGYPWMVKREDGTWLMALYHGQQKGPNSIWGLDLEV